MWASELCSVDILQGLKHVPEEMIGVHKLACVALAKREEGWCYRKLGGCDRACHPKFANVVLVGAKRGGVKVSIGSAAKRQAS